MREGSSRSSSSSNGSPDVCENNRELEEAGDPLFSPSDSSGESMCKIKNLDSGKEFVVDELGKDGMWNKLREELLSFLHATIFQSCM